MSSPYGEVAVTTVRSSLIGGSIGLGVFVLIVVVAFFGALNVCIFASPAFSHLCKGCSAICSFLVLLLTFLILYLSPTESDVTSTDSSDPFDFNFGLVPVAPAPNAAPWLSPAELVPDVESVPSPPSSPSIPDITPSPDILPVQSVPGTPAALVVSSESVVAVADPYWHGRLVILVFGLVTIALVVCASAGSLLQQQPLIPPRVVSTRERLVSDRVVWPFPPGYRVRSL
eukprot:TRINITY_DN48354_c0_g1_i1.p1 TRINITY_DN48354_c0_g1~~TRINITY_DN48354_c0_g1_i1.p1  ORF type:complete len:229 (-),score=24.51 TRINITY_DN48354_c0_g1_i1:681-1367(-)